MNKEKLLEKITAEHRSESNDFYKGVEIALNGVLKELSDTCKTDVLGMVRCEIEKHFETDSVTQVQHDWMIASGGIGFKLGTAFRKAKIEKALEYLSVCQITGSPKLLWEAIKQLEGISK